MSVEFRVEMEKLASLISGNSGGDPISQVASELEDIFGLSGSQTLLKEFSTRFAVTLEDAVKRPSVFRQALFFLLGDLGSTLVMRRLNSRIGETTIAAALTLKAH